MRVKILEIELTEPLPSFTPEALRGYSHLQALIRRKTVPLGYVWLETKDLEQAGLLQSEIEKICGEAIRQAELKEAQSDRRDPLPLPSVSVVVCTRDRAESLARCLESLAALDYPDLEILIVDNAPKDKTTRSIVEHFTSSYFRYLVEPCPGLDWARNRGIAEAKGEIIAYTDDDVRVDKLWVQNLVKAFARPEVMCVTGLVAPAERETEAQNLFENYGGFGRGFQRRYFSLALQSEWYYFPLNASIFGTGCNMAFRRTFFEQHGNFDVALDVGTPTHGAGDLEMFYRVARAGYMVVYEPEALIWHYHRREYAKLQRQLSDFGRGYYSFLTRCFVNDPPMRWTVLRWGWEWYKRWFWRRLRYRAKIGRKLVLREAFGALQGPFFYFISRRHARKITQKYGLNPQPDTNKPNT